MEEGKRMTYEIRPTPVQQQEADRRAQAEQQVIHVIQTARGCFVCSAGELLSQHPEESFTAIYTARPDTTDSGQQSQEQQAALYGPPGRGDYKPGDTITFASQDTGGQTLTGSILYVRAPAPAVEGGQLHPTVYITFVLGEAFPRMVYPGDVIEQR